MTLISQFDSTYNENEKQNKLQRTKPINTTDQKGPQSYVENNPDFHNPKAYHIAIRAVVKNDHI